MSIEGEIIRLTDCAKTDAELRRALIKSAEGQEPVLEFCEICRRHGFEIYPGELFAYGENMNDSKLRSVNGGGVNAIEGWDDAFMQLVEELEQMD